MVTDDARLQGRDGDEIDLLALIGHLWAGKAWIVSAMLLAVLAGAFFALSRTPIYKADALMQLETRSGALALPEGMQDLLGSDASGTAAIETEIEIIKSRMVIGEAVRELDLQLRADPLPLPVIGALPKRLGLPEAPFAFLRPYEWGGEQIVVGQLEVPDDWLDEEIHLTKTGADSFRVRLPDGSEHDGRMGETLALPAQGVSVHVDWLKGADGRMFVLERLAFEAAVRDVQQDFSVSAASRNSSILRLGYQHPDPRQAERVLDAISRAYVTQNISRSAAEAENSLKFIEEQLPIAEEALTEAQQKLNDYRKANQSVDLDYETQSLLQEATQIEADLNALAMQEDELKKRYTVNHPTYQALLENRDTLERRLERIRQETTGLPETQKEIFNLSRDLEVAQQVYIQLLNRAQELRVVRASTVGSVRIIDTAYSNGIRIYPRTSMILALSLVLGAMAGIGIVGLRRLLHRGIRGAEEIERLGLPVFGTVTFSTEAANHRKRHSALPILALDKPDDLVVEAMRSMRTALHFGMIDAKTNSVLFTSAAPGAGKSFTAVNLAVVAAQAGQRVCLIDADLRRGYLRRYFGQEKNTPGLAEYLAAEKMLDEVLHSSPVPGMSVITSGRFPPNPSELLMRAEFTALLKTLNDRFDLILIDAPPALAVTDPVVIGRSADATIVVVRHLQTMLGEVDAVKHTFEMAGVKVTGAVLNGYKQEEGRRYGSYSYRYSYKTGQR
ncbi:polysaccharide biosynthesis tyrosine autokinase [Rhodobacter sp. SGA-6-6]|uniref:polysaccharide biosynthesis tyrosine autokinase n=1 Tax=Rhodobacter sp. SGA-6-6 TaxID=2710882 RepID=UPI0013EBFA3C|nr:polysaccharide biosynthesis tyrosine autokinase [Rhodobacter sp. SGA-6-6]NGM44560.1 polysaccharide biosynthesis tyrosine autokinase [Rhodobacter sp. SGA-6-6]